MAKSKSIYIGVVKDFKGQPIKKGDDGAYLTIGEVILEYIGAANRMASVSPDQAREAFYAGFAIGQAGDAEYVSVTGKQWDAIKAIVDSGKIIDQAGKETEMYGNLIKQSAKDAVDGAKSEESK